MAPEDLFAGINPERLAMMQAKSAPAYERGGQSRRGGRGGGGRDAYMNGRRSNGVQNGNGNCEIVTGSSALVEESSALEKRAAMKNGGKKPDGKKKVEEELKKEKGEDQVVGDGSGEKKKKRKRDDAADVGFFLFSFLFSRNTPTIISIC